MTNGVSAVLADLGPASIAGSSALSSRSPKSPRPAPPDVEKHLAARAARYDGKQVRGAVTAGLCLRRTPGLSPCWK